MTHLLVRVKSRMFIRANRRMLGLLDGQYSSLARGRSLDIEDLRAYVAGDEVKDIDWKATARHGAPLVRTYTANRQHEIVLLADTGRNLAAVAESGEGKADIAVLVAGILGFLALRHGDRVAMIRGDAAGFRRSRTAGTEAQLESSLLELKNAPRATGPSSDLLGLLRHAHRTLRRRSIVVVIADDTRMSPELEEAVRLLQARHELLWCSITDAHLVRGVGDGTAMVDIEESWEIPEFLRRSRRLRADFDAASQQRDEGLRRALDGLAVSHARVSSADAVIPELLTMLGRRAHVRRR